MTVQADLDLIRDAMPLLHGGVYQDGEPRACTCLYCTNRLEGLAALSRLERLLQEQEEALREIESFPISGYHTDQAQRIAREMLARAAQPGSGKTG